MNNVSHALVENVEIQIMITWTQRITHARGMSKKKICIHVEHVIQTSSKPKKCVVLVNVMKLYILTVMEILVLTMMKIQINVKMTHYGLLYSTQNLIVVPVDVSTKQ